MNTEFNLDLIEKQTILKALNHFKRKTDAAKALNITLRTLYTRIEQYNLKDVYIKSKDDWWK